MSERVTLSMDKNKRVNVLQKLEEAMHKKFREMSEQEYKDYNDSYFTEDLVEEQGCLSMPLQSVFLSVPTDEIKPSND